MVCIWSANLTSAWGVLSIRMIVSNMHEWASIPLSMNLNTLLQVIEWNLPKGRRPTDEDCLSINDPADHNHTPDTGSILAEQGSTASQADDESSQGHDADDCSLPGSIPYTPKVSTELCASDPATDSPYSDRGDSRRTLHRATSSAGRASTWQETTPGHDSGIESDMPTSPAQEVSARGLRYQLKTGMDVRNLTTALTTPTKIMLPHKVLRRSSCSSTVGQPVLTDEGISKAPATLLDTEGPLPDAENHAEPSPSDMLSDDPISNSEMPLQGTNDSKEWTSAQPRAPSRPRAPRTRTGRTGHLYEQAWASAKELSERLTGSSSTGELGLPQMCAEEWYRQSQTGDGAYFNPAISASPMQSPGPSRVAEQDDSNSLRPSVSSRRSLFGRRTSSRASQPDAACMSPSKPPTDASSERSVASSRFELVDRSARHGLDVAKERYHNFDVKGAAREVGLGGVVDGYEKGRALMQARKGRGQGAVVRDEGSDEMQNVGLGGDQKTSNAEDDGHVCGGASAERSEAAEVDSVNTDGMSDQAAAMPGGWAV